MAFSSLTYEAPNGSIKNINRGEKLPFNESLVAREIRVGDDGEWVIIHYENNSSGSDGSVMIPKERVIRIGEEAGIF